MTGSVYYNENEPFAAQWLRNLIARGHLPGGEVDERSVEDVASNDLTGFRHVHLFAGIGGWARAAILADWPRDRELWTASVPCQPWSGIGRQLGAADPRDLWREAYRLIGSRRPSVVMGEQVSAAARADWLDRMLDDLARIHYAARPLIVPACAVDAPHRRERIYFVAEPDVMGDGERAGLERHARNDDDAPRRAKPSRSTATASGSGSAWSDAVLVDGYDGKPRRVKPGVRLLADGIPGRVGRLRAYGNAIVPPLAAEVMRAYLDVRA